MADPTKTLLDLHTLVSGPTVRIDDKAYELKQPDSLSVMDFKRLSVCIPRIEELLALQELTPAEETEVTDRFKQLCRIILTAPADVIDGLTDLQRVMIYQAFLALPHENLRRVGAMLRGVTPALQAPVATKKRTGASSPRGSRGSTVAPPSNGSLSSPSASFAPTS